MTEALLWLRRDLRRADHPALGAAAADGARVHAVFVIDPGLWGGAGPVRRAWLATSLRALAERLPLSIRLGDPREVVPRLARDRGAASVHVSTETTPYGRRRDAVVRERLGETPWIETGSPYAVTPGRVRKPDGTPYQVFTPWSKAWRAHGWRAPAVEPEGVRFADPDDDGRVEGMLDAALRDCPVPLPEAGEEAAMRRWRWFLDRIDEYDEQRDRPDLDATSRLSPYLKLGVVHPRTLLADLDQRHPGEHRFATELAWREFYADVLATHPRSAWHDLRPVGIDYDHGPASFEAWQEGHTGFPVVDAGMRQLAQTGWMHNRVRMVAASFLTKDLHQWWPAGARHFLDSLLDGDLASNSHGWQWTAGTGTDAAPYFRVFNPTGQGERFDPRGDYVRTWVPELAHLPGKAVHRPWDHDGGYDHGYPRPLVDHDEERRVALARWKARRRSE